ncbi:MAG: NADH-quinone oxidoreductase subunit N [Desulfuromonadaceae bacterium]|nr:NADH-quinone oxidoreductase subunit N [Desulfuromonadaceae bacterium]MDD2848900.1 NADH-quinone oxidoreductase subunit N [Desulfuromonadaceae bacterium]MDD4132143.1 NADH-quinone oxidoreductase subunit N [Desulfuromonadaceae bacterium]
MTTVDLWIALPLMLLAVGALLTLLVGAVTRNETVTTAIGVTVTLGAACWLLQTPPAAVAPTLGLSAAGLPRLFSVFFTLLAAGVLCLSTGYNRGRDIHGEEYPATVLFATFGMLALASATNLMTLFLGLEAMSFGFYILVAIDLKRATSGETGLKYLLPGALSTAFLAFGIALLYCVSGTLSIQGAVQFGLADGRPDPVALAGWGCLLVGVAFKLSLAPAHLWTPDVYQGAPAPVVAFLSGGSKAAAILLLLLLLPRAVDASLLRAPLWGLALLSMLVGNLAALLQNRVRRMMAYSSIAQMGYVVVALLSGTGGGYQAAAFYAMAYGVISLAAFGAISVLERQGCGETLDDYRGLGHSRPFASGVLALALFALAGIPPTVGFTGKFLIFTAAVRSGEITLAVCGILLAAISVYYYLRVVIALYGKHPGTADSSRPTLPEYLVLIVASAAIILPGLWPNELILLLSHLLP